MSTVTLHGPITVLQTLASSLDLAPPTTGPDGSILTVPLHAGVFGEVTTPFGGVTVGLDGHDLAVVLEAPAHVARVVDRVCRADERRVISTGVQLRWRLDPGRERELDLPMLGKVRVLVEA